MHTMGAMNTQRGFTLLETMVVAGIIGTVASLAIPAYQGYVARAQVAEAVRLASAARTVVTEQYTLNGAWPEELAELEPAQYTASLTLASDGEAPEATLVATMKTSGVQHELQGKSIRFSTTDGGATWACTSTEIAQAFLPRACQG